MVFVMYRREILGRRTEGPPSRSTNGTPDAPGILQSDDMVHIPLDTRQCNVQSMCAAATGGESVTRQDVAQVPWPAGQQISKLEEQ